MAAIKAALANDVLDGNDFAVNAADAAAIAKRIGAPEAEVRQALNDPETVREVMRECRLPVDAAVFILIANAQAQKRKDAIVTVPA